MANKIRRTYVYGWNQIVGKSFEERILNNRPSQLPAINQVSNTLSVHKLLLQINGNMICFSKSLFQTLPYTFSLKCVASKQHV